MAGAFAEHGQHRLVARVGALNHFAGADAAGHLGDARAEQKPSKEPRLP